MRVISCLVIATVVFTVLSRTLNACSSLTFKQLLIADNGPPSDPYGNSPYGPNPHGRDPHGADPHDENHDPNLPANNKDYDRKNQDPYGGEVPH